MKQEVFLMGTRLLSLALIFGLGVELRACQICLPYPTRSVADDLIEAEHIVLCREDPNKPFTLAITSILKGDQPNTPLDLFLDSSSRRLLASYPDRSIVCVSSAQPGQAPWKRVATLTPELRPILDHILEHSESWTSHPVKRATFFADYLGHANPQLSTLAHLEVARAPYDTIKALADRIPPERIRSFLANYRMLEWHALYILLLAQSNEPEDQQRIQEAVESNARFSLTLQTAAWATAFIEIEESKALEFFNQHYLQNTDRSDEEIRAILAALSVHGTKGHTHLRDAIVPAYLSLTEQRPEFLPVIIKDLTVWQRWDLARQVETQLSIEADTLDLSTTLELRNYLRLATQGAPQNTTRKPAETSLFGILIVLLSLPVLLKCIGPRHAAGSPDK